MTSNKYIENIDNYINTNNLVNDYINIDNLYKNGNNYYTIGNVTISIPFTIKKNETLTIKEGNKLNITENISVYGTLIINGILNNLSCIINVIENGQIEQNSILNNNGIINGSGKIIFRSIKAYNNTSDISQKFEKNFYGYNEYNINNNTIINLYNNLKTIIYISSNETLIVKSHKTLVITKNIIIINYGRIDIIEFGTFINNGIIINNFKIINNSYSIFINEHLGIIKNYYTFIIRGYESTINNKGIILNYDKNNKHKIINGKITNNIKSKKKILLEKLLL